MRLMKRPEVQQDTGLSSSEIYNRLRQGTFPKPVTLGPKSVAWVEAEVRQWIADRIAARDAGENRDKWPYVAAGKKSAEARRRKKLEREAAERDGKAA